MSLKEDRDDLFMYREQLMQELRKTNAQLIEITQRIEAEKCVNSQENVKKDLTE